MGKPHILAIPYPAQGHVIPMMELAQCLAKKGIKVTFVNSEFNHERIIKALLHTGNTIDESVNLASIADGLEPWEDRNDLSKLVVAMPKIMPPQVEALIEKINQTDGGDKVTCIIADFGLAWIIELAQKLGIKRAAFLPASALVFALAKNVSKLMDEGIIDVDGMPLKQEMIQLSPEMPAISTSNLVWLRIGDSTTQKTMFQGILKHAKVEELIDRIVCNSSHELEAGALEMVPKCMPIGPLLASNRLGQTAGHFWAEDAASLSWLDQQPPSSVIYVAFGSLTILNVIQFQELALGLELTNRPFLWVVRQDMTNETDKSYPKGFSERIMNRGKIVDWAPQQKVLSHPSVACFMSHCGWNSTIEGTSSGVPFLCWPYFADQFVNEDYICGHWRVGLSLEKDGLGIVGREEIRKKVEIVASDESYKSRALDLQSAIRGESSQKNLDNFVDWIKET